MLSKKEEVFGILILLIVLVISSCNSGSSSETKERDSTSAVVEDKDTDKPAIASPRKQAEGQIGDVNVSVDYGSPGVKDRVIWGGLEPYGKVWRAGANETTSFEFGEDVNIGGKVVQAGKYGFYLIPRKDKPWTAIINTHWNREEHGAWGAYNYSPKHDVVRVEVEPQWVEESQERLEYTIADNAIDLAWEKARISIPVEPAKK